MFRPAIAKAWATIYYPEIWYCAWLGTMPLLLLGCLGKFALGMILDEISWTEVLLCWGESAWLTGICGALIGGLAHKFVMQARFTWILLSFLIPLFVLAGIPLLEAHWNITEVIEAGSFLWQVMLYLSLSTSVTAITIRLIFQPILPKIRGIVT
jgi:hypothetical protein